MGVEPAALAQDQASLPPRVSVSLYEEAALEAPVPPLDGHPLDTFPASPRPWGDGIQARHTGMLPSQAVRVAGHRHAVAGLSGQPSDVASWPGVPGLGSSWDAGLLGHVGGPRCLFQARGEKRKGLPGGFFGDFS